MSRRRERPINPLAGGGEDDARETLDWHGKATWAPVPMTALAALMETAPGEEPTRSTEEYADLRETLGEAIDGLPGYEREVFEAVFIERATYREIALRPGVGVATVDRMKRRAVNMLRLQLEGEVAEWLTQ
jgi:RNA polymerase sigma factor (sigma-70 family)